MAENFFIFFFLFLLFAACVSDVREMRIPNALNLAMLGLFAVAALYNHFAQAEFSFLSRGLASNLTGFAVLAVLGAVIFFMNLAGGGDAKMVAMCGLWLGLPALPAFFLAMSVIGGVLGVVALVLQKRAFLLPLAASPNWQHSWPARLGQGQRVVPYGIALAGGAIYAFVYQHYLIGVAQ